MGPGNFTTKCLGFPRPFFNLISIFQPSCQRIFFYKMPCLPKLKWALDLFTRWPHYKMTHKNPFCSGLKATHFVWEIRRRIIYIYALYILHICTCTYIIEVSKRGVLGSADDAIAFFLHIMILFIVHGSICLEFTCVCCKFAVPYT